MSKFVITAEDVGRLARTKDGRVVQIIDFEPCREYAVSAREVEGKWKSSWTAQGGYFTRLGVSELDLVEFVEDEKEISMEPLNITKQDEGKIFLNRKGHQVRVILVGKSSPKHIGSVVAVSEETGQAFNYYETGRFLNDSESDYDLVKRYETMTWPKFCKNVLCWATDRGIIANSNSRIQVLKGLTKYGELVEAVLNDEWEDFTDAIGDILVCLVNAAGIAGRDLRSSLLCPVPLSSVDYALSTTAEVLGRVVISRDSADYDIAVWQIQVLAEALDVDFIECLESAWNAIKDCKGYLNEQGFFVKES